ncbi:Uma2 family endonuclease [Okeania sp. SIO1I7]|uniref:Uma2 family endonuclease n=1 Tax=Okeania sp. SIO1I7 TaxID=2607772 RepID=UPI0013FB786B|nr:Uma2 family endonuclease [Okeania sp. SIO1I7]NET25880.1 Uma2 family endonuclease [Okeania sp. SIO1I7]
MSEKLTILPHEYPDTSNMILEDDAPLDSFINEKQQRLLTTVFYSGAEIPINVPFIVAANVGLFSHVRDSGIVPDVFLSLNIVGEKEWWERNVRSYLFWEFGKPPDVVIEIVSPTPGNELGSKLTDYAKLRIPYYVVYDPLQKLSETVLQVFQLQFNSYIPKNDAGFPDVNLGLTLWSGTFENINGTWLRWCNVDGNVIKTGDEIAAEKNAEISQKDVEISQKDAEISQKDAEISQKNAEIKQALLLAIEMGLKLKFGDELVGILSEISEINDVKLLERIVSQIPQISSMDELRKLY